ncbi:MAG: DUF4012 domain-containing protein [Methanobacteriaceae archaeon]
MVLTCISALFIAYEYKKAEGELQILVLLVNTNNSTGVDTVDMAFVIPMVNYDAINITPVYPGGMYHPNATAPAELQGSGGTKLLLHDTLWTNDTKKGVKLAQEIVEYNTGMKTNAVVIMTPIAVKAMIDSVGPLYVEPLGYVNSSSLDSLINEKNLEKSRGKNLNIVMRTLMETYHNPTKRPALIKAVIYQYLQGNIIPIPNELFLQLGIASGINKLV